MMIQSGFAGCVLPTSFSHPRLCETDCRATCDGVTERRVHAL